ncbi:MAG: hypothetical protein ACOC6J_06825 [Spirochaetota bacterium]
MPGGYDQDQHDLQRESETLIRLGMLIRKRRAPEDRRSVEEILASAADSAEKVRWIEEIDRASARSNDEESEARRHYIGTPTDDLPEAPARARHPPRVKAPLSKQGYLGFLLRERARILQFGTTTRTILPGYFPPSVRLSPDVAAFFIGFLRPTARDIHATLSQLMGNAWMYLSRHDYNLLVLVLDLCTTIERLPVTAESYEARRAPKTLRAVEERLLALRYEHDAVPRVFEAIETLRSWNRRAIENLSALPGLVKRVISRTPDNPSLIDALLAVNMVGFRRYLTEQDVTLSELGRLVETRVFDCSDETRRQIDEFIERLVSQLDGLARERKDILRVRAFLERDERGEVDLSATRELVESSQSSWKAARDNPAVLAEATFRPLAALIAALVAEPVTLSGVGTTPLFRDRPFVGEVDRLNHTATAIEALVFQLPSLPHDRFVAIVDKRETATRYEAELLMHVQAYLDAVGAIRTRLQELLARAVEIDRGFEPLDLHRATSERAPVPLDAVVESGPSLVRSRPLRTALGRVVRLAYELAFYFGDRQIRRVLKREHQVERDMDHMLETIERVANPEQAHEIVQRFRRDLPGSGTPR